MSIALCEASYMREYLMHFSVCCFFSPLWMSVGAPTEHHMCIQFSYSGKTGSHWNEAEKKKSILELVYDVHTCFLGSHQVSICCQTHYVNVGCKYNLKYLIQGPFTIFYANLCQHEVIWKTSFKTTEQFWFYVTLNFFPNHNVRYGFMHQKCCNLDFHDHCLPSLTNTITQTAFAGVLLRPLHVDYICHEKMCSVW